MMEFEFRCPCFEEMQLYARWPCAHVRVKASMAVKFKFSCILNKLTTPYAAYFISFRVILYGFNRVIHCFIIIQIETNSSLNVFLQCLLLWQAALISLNIWRTIYQFGMLFPAQDLLRIIAPAPGANVINKF